MRKVDINIFLEFIFKNVLDNDKKPIKILQISRGVARCVYDDGSNLTRLIRREDKIFHMPPYLLEQIPDKKDL